MSDYTLRITIRERAVLRALRIAIAVVVLAGISSVYAMVELRNHSAIVQRLYLDGDHNLGGLFSSVLLLGIAGLMGLIAQTKGRAGQHNTRQWRVLAALTVLLAIDESLGFHEYAAYYVHLLLGTGGEAAHLGWAVLGMGLVAGFVAAFYGLLSSLPAHTRLRLIVASLVYVGGALGLEFLGGRFFEGFGAQSLAYLGTSILEETCEMAGLYLAIRALLPYLHELQHVRSGPVPQHGHPVSAPRPVTEEEMA